MIDESINNAYFKFKSDMENQFKKLKKSLDSINNKFSAGLSGDLAEVCVYQGSLYGTNVTIGLNGHWNNTDLPILRYLQQGHNAHWEMPDSEILAGIDSKYFLRNLKK